MMEAFINLPRSLAARREVFWQGDQLTLRHFLAANETAARLLHGRQPLVLSHIYNTAARFCECGGFTEFAAPLVAVWHFVYSPKPWDRRPEDADVKCESPVRALWWEAFEEVVARLRAEEPQAEAAG